MSETTPESAEVVGARARARVAAIAPRRPVVVHVVAPSLRREQTPDMAPPEPQRYVPVSLARAPWVTWEDSIREPREELLAAMRRAWTASVAGVAPCEDREVACYSGRDPVRLDDADDYLTGPR